MEDCVQDLLKFLTINIMRNLVENVTKSYGVSL